MSGQLPWLPADHLLIAGGILYLMGITTGLWLGFKLWRVTYVDARMPRTLRGRD